MGVKSPTNGIIDTTTAHDRLVLGMFALMAEYEAALLDERTQAGLTAARARGRTGDRKPKVTPAFSHFSRTVPPHDAAELDQDADGHGLARARTGPVIRTP